MKLINKRHSFGSAMHWIKGRSLTLRRYLNEFYPIYDWEIIKHFFYENPIQSKVILKDYCLSQEAKQQEVLNIFLIGKSKIVYVVGARGSGKTATAFWLSEEVHRRTGRPIFYLSNNIEQNVLPKWMKILTNLNQVPQGAFAIVDESALQFNSRDAMKQENKDLGKELAIARHKEIFLIFITQHTSMSDVNIRRLKDMVIWKQSNDYSIGEQGSKSTQEHKFWNKVRNMMSPRQKNECLFEYPAHRRFINFKHELPECWSDSLSRSWKDSKFGRKKEEELVAIKDKQPIKILRL